MSRRETRRRERRYLPDTPARHAVAVEAARLLYRREFKEYYQAKREAARRLGCKVLPTNSEIHHQLLIIADLTEGEARTERLNDMRLAALDIMTLLERFRPRLIGSVWTGHIRAGSDIDIHLYAASLEEVEQRLQEAKLSYDVEFVRSRSEGKETEFVHIGLTHQGHEVEMTLYSPEEYHHHPTCSITGGPMDRASLAELRQVVEVRDRPAPVTAGRPDTEPVFSPPLDTERALELLPELARCRGVSQNHFHHLDVLDHTLLVVHNVQEMEATGFEILGELAEAVRAHLFTDGPGSWNRASLLNLAALCHDIGKPDTASLHHSGRIRFIGHESVGARLCGDIACRLRLPPATAAALETLVALHMEPLMAPTRQAPPSELHGIFRRAGDLAPELFLLSLADVESARGPAQPLDRVQVQLAFVKEMLEEFFAPGFLRFPNLPVSAVDLETEFGVKDERLKSRLVEQLTREYLDGYFQGREDGLSVAAELLNTPAELWASP